MRVCVCVCERVYALRIVSRDKILRFKNTFSSSSSSSSSSSDGLCGRKATVNDEPITIRVQELCP